MAERGFDRPAAAAARGRPQVRRGQGLVAEARLGLANGEGRRAAARPWDVGLAEQLDKGKAQGSGPRAAAASAASGARASGAGGAATARDHPHELWSSSGRPTTRVAGQPRGPHHAASRGPSALAAGHRRAARKLASALGEHGVVPMRGARRPPAAASVAHRGYYAGRRGRGGRDATHAAHAAHAATIAVCSPRGDRPRVAASLVVRFVGASGRQHRIGGGSARLPRRQLDRRGQAAKHGVGRFSEPPAAASLLLVRSALFGASPAGAGISRVVSHRLPQSEGEERRRARAVVRRQHGSGARLVLLTRYLRARARAIVEWLSVRCVTCVVGVVASWADQFCDGKCSERRQRRPKRAYVARFGPRGRPHANKTKP